MSVHRPKRLFSLTPVPRINFTGDTAKEFTTNDSGNRDSEQPPAVREPIQKQTQNKEMKKDSQLQQHYQLEFVGENDPGYKYEKLFCSRN